MHTIVYKWDGFVDNAIDYPYSSAKDYSDEKGLVLIEFPA